MSQQVKAADTIENIEPAPEIFTPPINPTDLVIENLDIEIEDTKAK